MKDIVSLPLSFSSCYIIYQWYYWYWQLLYELSQAFGIEECTPLRFKGVSFNWAIAHMICTSMLHLWPCTRPSNLNQIQHLLWSFLQLKSKGNTLILRISQWKGFFEAEFVEQLWQSRSDTWLYWNGGQTAQSLKSV